MSEDDTYWKLKKASAGQAVAAFFEWRKTEPIAETADEMLGKLGWTWSDLRDIIFNPKL